MDIAVKIAGVLEEGNWFSVAVDKGAGKKIEQEILKKDKDASVDSKSHISNIWVVSKLSKKEIEGLDGVIKASTPK